MFKKAHYVNDELGEDMALNMLIVIDNASRLADKSDVFLIF